MSGAESSRVGPSEKMLAFQRYLEAVSPGEWTLCLPEGSFRQQDADQGLQVASEPRLDS